jgi:hypothetical protein
MDPEPRLEVPGKILRAAATVMTKPGAEACSCG